MWEITQDCLTGETISIKSRGHDGRELPYRFRMLDGDGEVYFEGRSNDNDTEGLFAPLDDYGTPDSGCT